MSGSFQTRLQSVNQHHIVVQQAFSSGGEPFLLLMQCDAQGLQKLQRAYQAGKGIDFKSCGKILDSRWGTQVPDDWRAPPK